MLLNVDIDLLTKLHSQAPYATTDADEIVSITLMERWKLIEAELPRLVAPGQYNGPALVSRVRPRGQAAMNNGGDTLI